MPRKYFLKIDAEGVFNLINKTNDNDKIINTTHKITLTKYKNGKAG